MQTLASNYIVALFLRPGSVNMLIHGLVTAIRLVMDLLKFTPFLFSLFSQKFVSTPLSLLYAFKVATELRTHFFTIFRTLTIFIISSRQFLTFPSPRKAPNTFFLKSNFYFGEKYFPLSTKVYGKMDIKIFIRNRAKVSFQGAVALLR